MRLTAKIAIALLLGICVLLAVHARKQVDRATEAFASDMREDQRTVGRLFHPIVARTWRTEGQAAAMYLLEYTNRILDENAQTTTMSLRSVWLDRRASESRRPAVPLDQLAPVRAGQEVSLVSDAPDGVERLYTYVPLQLGMEGERVGALEIAEPTAPLHSFASLTRRRLVLTTLALLGVCALIVLVVGSLFVARPVSRLAAAAERIGAGDLDARVEVAQHDEIGHLAASMNQMAERLKSARGQIAAQTEEKVRAVEQLRHADRLSSVGTLASGIAHELGTPLAVISGRAKMISDGTVAGDSIADYAQSIARQADKMADIIRQLLDFARRRNVSLSVIDLQPLVEQTTRLIAPLARKRGAVVEITKDDRPVRAAVDAVQIQQVLTNLLVNAVHASVSGGTIRVDLRTTEALPPADHPAHAQGRRPYVRLQVSDEGEGMRGEILAKIFEPFFTTKAIGEGTGLGLAVSYGIVQDHGGWFEVESQPGQGSTFSAYLPTSNAPPAAG